MTHLRGIRLVVLLQFITALCIAQPRVDSFSPLSGPVGSTVVIHGHNFNTTPQNNSVFFGPTAATVTNASSDSLTVIVPDAANYEFIYVADTTAHLGAYSLNPFKVTFGCGTAFTSSSFTATTDSATGALPVTVTSGDIDGDGKADLIVADYDNNLISIFQNTSTVSAISYAPKIDFRTGPHPMSVSLGDFNNDGRLDLAIPTLSNDSATVYENKSTPGNIVLGYKQDFEVGFSPGYFAVGDLNRDGKPDLAIVNQCFSTITILKNTSVSNTINFEPPFSFIPNTYPQRLGIGDMDGDSIPDIVLSGPGTGLPSFTGTVSIFRNISSGGTFAFEPKVDYVIGDGQRNVALGDLTGDGKLDIAVPVQNLNSIAVLQNTSTGGSVSFNAPNYYPAGYLVSYADIDDMNGDGKPDLIAISYTSWISVLRNASTPVSLAFYNKVSYATTSDVAGFCSVDLNNDSKIDMVTVSNMSNQLSIHKNTQCEVTGIQDQANDTEMAIYPNPFHTSTTLTLKKAQTNAVLLLTDINGAEQRRIPFSGNSLTIERGNLAAGFYVAKIYVDEKLLSIRKVVID